RCPAARLAMARQRVELRPGGHRAAVLLPRVASAAWGLHEYWQAAGDPAARDAAGRAAELLLEHRLFRGLAADQGINRASLVPRYPPYWHYDILQALLVDSDDPAVDLSSSIQVANMVFLRLPAGWSGAAHPVPRRQFIVFLAGEAEASVSDGEVRGSGPGCV